MNKTDMHELISALADGQVGAEERDLAFAALALEPDALAAWEQYHLVGDVLRSADLATATTTTSADFVRRLAGRLAQEPSPVALPLPASPTAASVESPAANDPLFRWKLVAGFASLAAAAAVGWNLLASSSVPLAGPQLAAVPAASEAASGSTVTNATAVMIRDPRLDELLSAHQQLGGAGPLPMPASFARQATFEQPGR